MLYFWCRHEAGLPGRIGPSGDGAPATLLGQPSNGGMQLLTTYRRAARRLGLFVTFSVRAAIQLLRPPCAIRNRRRHSGCLPGAKTSATHSWGKASAMQPGSDPPGDRRRGLAAHRRPRRDGRAGLISHPGPLERQDHPRRRKHLPTRNRSCFLHPPGRRKGRGAGHAHAHWGSRGGLRVDPPLADPSSVELESSEAQNQTTRPSQRRCWLPSENTSP